jgi:RNA polymerase nonessential primary-like sigma factor
MQDSGDRRLLEVNASDDAPGPEDLVLERELENAVASILPKLPAVERQILEWHFGIGGAPARTLQQIGAELGYTREHVRQIELRALDRTRRLLEASRRR